MVIGSSASLARWVTDFAGQALGREERIFVVQFQSGLALPAIVRLAHRHPQRLEVRAMGRDDPSRDPSIEPVDAKWAEDGLSLAARALRKGPWDHVVLLEVDAVVRRGLVESDQVLELLDVRPAKRGIFLCCTEASVELEEAVDRVVRLPE